MACSPRTSACRAASGFAVVRLANDSALTEGSPPIQAPIRFQPSASTPHPRWRVGQRDKAAPTLRQFRALLQGAGPESFGREQAPSGLTGLVGDLQRDVDGGFPVVHRGPASAELPMTGNLSTGNPRPTPIQGLVQCVCDAPKGGQDPSGPSGRARANRHATGQPAGSARQNSHPDPARRRGSY